MSKNKAIAALIFASIFWGFGFIGTVWGMEGTSPVWFLIERLSVALTIGFPFLFIKKPVSLKSDLKLALPPGFFLALTFWFQTVGLQTTTATNSGFLTTLYVVMIPILHFLSSRVRPPTILLASVLLACVGTYFLAGAHLASFSRGDIYTIFCAFFASIQILMIGKRSKQTTNAFIYNYFQSFWCLFFLIPMLAMDPRVSIPSTGHAWVGILTTAIGSTLIAFSLQVQAQRVLSPVLASLLCLLEAPFAMLFGILFLGETINGVRLTGTFLIFISAILAIFSETDLLSLVAGLTKKKSQ